MNKNMIEAMEGNGEFVGEVRGTDTITHLAVDGRFERIDREELARLRADSEELARLRQVPEGFALVPVDPTPEMVEALKARVSVTNRGGILNAGHALAAAIAAAPKGDSHE